jgi:hypothetical protein
MKVYITKYALTKGIFELDAVQTDNPRMIASRGQWTNYYHKPDWHSSKSDAINRAEDMREAKIKSLEKQLKKIKDIEF